MQDLFLALNIEPSFIGDTVMEIRGTDFSVVDGGYSSLLLKDSKESKYFIVITNDKYKKDIYYEILGKDNVVEIEKETLLALSKLFNIKDYHIFKVKKGNVGNIEIIESNYDDLNGLTFCEDWSEKPYSEFIVRTDINVKNEEFLKTVKNEELYKIISRDLEKTLKLLSSKGVTHAELDIHEMQFVEIDNEVFLIDPVMIVSNYKPATN